MPDLIIENVRCFAGRHEATLSPITILVGENSAGKSTFLASCRLAWDALFRPAPVDFNDPPFRLGTYTEIASRVGGAGTTNSFSLGFKLPMLALDGTRTVADTRQLSIVAQFGNSVGQPDLQSWRLECGEYSVSKTAQDEKPISRMVVGYPQGRVRLNDPHFSFLTAVSTAQYWPWISHELKLLIQEDNRNRPSPRFHLQGQQPTANDIEILDQLVGTLSRGAIRNRPYAFAPIRTEPKRTYDPQAENPTPGGDHVPMLLARLKSTGASDPTWHPLITALDDFGRRSGLFDAIDVRTFGETASNSPFQIRVRSNSGSDFNLVDVGYGVSQALPVLVDTSISQSQLMLLQQPEVHLHPRAQAELGSFFAKVISQQTGRTLVIETHSDHLIDRIRMDLRDGTTKLRPEDVSILYFERLGDASKIHHISLDQFGNVVGAPETYRGFFLREESRLVTG